jgi:AhpD family alkylhydroperoxidase
MHMKISNRVAPIASAMDGPTVRVPWYARLILALQKRKYGSELESGRHWARLPRAFLALTLLYRSLDGPRSKIDAGLRSLIQVHVSRINWCAFCVDLNGAAALERSVPAEKLAALPDYARSPHYSERERAALDYAEAMTNSALGVDDALRSRMRNVFDQSEMLELTALIAFQNMSSKFNAALGIAPQGFCSLPIGQDGRGSE